MTIRVGIMQPYFLPYIGYWQLMSYVDKYVVFDDVNYINRGWIDRNRIIINDTVQYINLPVIGKSQNKFINEIMINKDKKAIGKTIKTVELAYKKAPFFTDIFPMFEEIMQSDNDFISDFIMNSFRIIGEYLDINTKLIMSSELAKDNTLKGQDKILQICKLLNADEYVNAIGGQDLYSREYFDANNIKLKFLKTETIEYKQNNIVFQPNLSIIDVLMNCSCSEVKDYMNKFELI